VAPKALQGHTQGLLAAYNYLRPEFDIALADITQPDLCSDDYPHHKMRVTRVVALTPKTSVNLAV
jgi:hypothetical protein